MQCHDGASGADHVRRTAPGSEGMPDAETRTTLVDGDAAHGHSVASPAHGIATGPAGLIQE